MSNWRPLQSISRLSRAATTSGLRNVTARKQKARRGRLRVDRAPERLESRAMLASMSISVGDAAVYDDGVATMMRFAISRQGDLTPALKIAYTTANAADAPQATAGDDYLTTTGVATIASGQSRTFVDVPITTDQIVEGAESFALRLTGVVDVLGTSTAWHDEAAPILDERPRAIAIADLNNDGRHDLITGNVLSLGLMLGATDPGATSLSFAEQQTIATTSTPTVVATGDFDLDGRVDVALGYDDDNGVTVLFNRTIPGANHVTFADPLRLESIAATRAIVVGDINLDGKPDIVQASADDDRLSIFRNSSAAGATTFLAPREVSLGVGSRPETLAIADFNSDGWSDIVASDAAADRVAVLLNTSPASGSLLAFRPATYAATQAAPVSLTVGDVNLDGRIDVVTANHDDTISVLLNMTAPAAASTAFASHQSFDAGAAASVSLADFNADGKPDIAIAAASNAGAIVFDNHSLPGALQVEFEQRGTAIVDAEGPGDAPSGIVATDLNGDGRSDLVLLAVGRNEVTTLVNATEWFSGVPDFLSASANPGNTLTNVVADFNLDGKPDSAFTGFNNDTIYLAVNASESAGTPTFRPNQPLRPGGFPAYLAAGDINLDGKPDLLAATLMQSGLSVMLNTTTPGATILAFTDDFIFSTAGATGQVVLGDLNGDGKLDVVVADQGNGEIVVLFNTTPKGSMTPTFNTRQEIANAGRTADVAIADINGDGRGDIITIDHSQQGDGLSIFVNETPLGATTFVGQRQELETGYEPNELLIGDVNGDGRKDLVTPMYANSYGDSAEVHLNLTSPGATTVQFAAPQVFYTGDSRGALGDLNGDGRLDLAISGDGASVIANETAPGAANITLGDRIYFPGNSVTVPISIVDMNLDGRPDLLRAAWIAESEPAALVDAETIGTIFDDAAPHAIADQYRAEEDSEFVVAANDGVLANDLARDAGAIVAELVSGTSHGELTLRADGSFDYLAASNYFGPDSFTYRVRDGDLVSTVVTVAIDVIAVNDPPPANDDDFTTTEDVRLTAEVLPVSDVELIPSGAQWRYWDRGNYPSPSWNERVLTYDDSAWPRGNAELGYGDADEATIVGYGGNASQKHITTLFRRSFYIDTPSWVNSLTLHLKFDDGIVVYINGFEVARRNMPSGAINFNTLAAATQSNDGDLFETVLNVSRNSLYNGENAIAVEIHQAQPDSTDISFDLRLEGNVLRPDGVLVNDPPDIEGTHPTAILVTPPQHGRFLPRLDLDGSFTYIPDPDFFGIDTFQYRAVDGRSSSPITTARIHVIGVDDAPRSTDDVYNLDEDSVIAVDAGSGVLANDIEIDGQSVTVELVQPPLNGSLELAADGSFVYTPVADFFGADAFSYRSSDGALTSPITSVALLVAPVSDPPTAVDDVYDAVEAVPLVVDVPLSTDALHQFSETFENTAFPPTLTAAPGTVVIENGSLHANSSSDAWVRSAAGDFLTGDFMLDVDFRLTNGYATSRVGFGGHSTSNTNRPPDLGLMLQVESGSGLNSGGTIRLYVNSSNEYTTLGALGDWAPSRVRIEKTGNRLILGYDESFHGAFVADYTHVIEDVANSFLVPENSYLIFGGSRWTEFDAVTTRFRSNRPAVRGVLANDLDDADNALVAVLVEPPQHGSLNLSPDGTFTYLADRQFTGVDQFRYRVNDGTYDSNLATVVLNVSHRPPLGVSDAYAVAEDGELIVDALLGVLANDDDTFDNPLSAELTSGPMHGTLTFAADGSFRYVPSADYVGADTFAYRATDGTLYSASTAVTIMVSAVNDAPTVRDDRFHVDAGQKLTVGLPVAMPPLRPGQLLDSTHNLVTERVAQTTTWHEARAIAESMTLGNIAGRLMKLQPNKTFFVANFASEAGWLGAYQDRRASNYSEPMDGWRWVDGQPLQPHWWASPVPQGGDGRDVLAMVDPGSATGPGSNAYNYTHAAGNEYRGVFWVEYPLDNPRYYDTLVKAKADWHYLDNGSNQGTLWRAAEFDDAAWKRGPAPFGYGEADESTLIHCGPNAPACAAGNFATTYFRHEFSVDDPSRIRTLILDLMYDDGIAVYLNGVEVVRQNLTTLATSNTLATGNAPDDGQSLVPFSIDPALLSVGHNVLAVEVHQAAANSTDISFDAQLVAEMRHSIGVLDNDTDTEQNPMTVVVLTPPAHGQLALLTNGAFEYTPDPGFLGVDSFMYRATDGNSFSAPATATIEVRNTVPASAIDVYDAVEDATLVVAATQGVLSNDVDAEHLSLTTELIRAPQHGTIMLASDGSFRYTPTAGYTGIDSFAYRAHDTRGYSPITDVLLSVANAPDAPVASRDIYATSTGQTLTISTPPAVAPDYADLIRQHGAIGHWRLAESTGNFAQDAISDNHGAFHGTIRHNEPGALVNDSDPATEFDGASAFLDLGSPAALRVYRQFTLEAWINPDSVVGVRNIFGRPTREDGFALAVVDGGLEFYSHGAEMWREESLIVPGRWQHVIAVFNSSPQTSSVSFYVDGQYVGGGSGSGQADGANLSEQSILIGGGPFGQMFDGGIDEVAIYDRPLTPAEIASHFAAGATRTGTMGEATRYATNGQRSEYLATQYGSSPGITGGFQLTQGNRTNQNNTIGFARTAIGAYRTIVADFEFSISLNNGPYGDGFGFLLLNTANFGTSGPVPQITSEEPNVAGSIGVGFDFYANDGESDNHLSLHYAGSRIGTFEIATSDLRLLGAFQAHASIRVDFVETGALVNVTLHEFNGPPIRVIQNVLIPNVAAYESRVGFSGRTGNATAQQSVSNISVQFFDAPVTQSGSIATLVAKRAVWRYRDDLPNTSVLGTYPSDAQGDFWNQADYDDSNWSTGAAILGYGEIDAGPLGRTIGFGPSSSSKYATALFRRAFNVVDALLVAALSLELLSDDAAAIYINGVEVIRNNLPGTMGDGTLRTSTLASEVGSESAYSTFSVNLAAFPGLLVDGTNVIAVEVHQQALNSSDLGFDLSLTASIVPQPVASVLVNDRDDDGEALTASLIAGPFNGSLTLSSDGTFTYVPLAGFVGVDQFVYRANDGALDSAETLVTINVGSANRAPIAADDWFVARNVAAFSVAAKDGLLKNDADANGDEITVAILTPPARGTLSLSGDGSFVYTPTPGFIGVDAFTYRLADGDGTVDHATATIQVVTARDPINGIPLASDDAFEATAGVLSIAAPGVLTNDVDPEHRPLAAVVEQSPWHGSLRFATDGSFTYTPLPGFTGQDSFTYRATDGNTFSDPATVTINVGAEIPSGGLPSPALDDTTSPGTTLPGSVPTPGSQSSTTSPGTLPMSGDLNGDGRVDRADLAVVVAAYGSMAGSPAYDAVANLNGDGRVSLADAIVLRNGMIGFSQPSSSNALVRRASDRISDERREIESPTVTAARLSNSTVDEVNSPREELLRAVRRKQAQRPEIRALGSISPALIDRVFASDAETSTSTTARRVRAIGRLRS